METTFTKAEQIEIIDRELNDLLDEINDFGYLMEQQMKTLKYIKNKVIATINKLDNLDC